MKTRFLHLIPAAFTLLVAACASSQKAAPEPYPPEIRSAFMQSCTAEGAPSEICLCVLDQLQTKYTVEDMANDRVEQDWLERTSADCVGQ